MEGGYLVNLAVLVSAGTVVACRFVHLFQAQQVGMGIDQFGGILVVYLINIVFYHNFDTAQFREETVQHIFVRHSSLQVHQLFFATVEDAVFPDDAEYRIGIGRLGLLQQLFQTFPVFGYRRYFNAVARQVVSVADIAGKQP